MVWFNHSSCAPMQLSNERLFAVNLNAKKPTLMPISARPCATGRRAREIVQPTNNIVSFSDSLWRLAPQ
jgi:hypothetical protein